MIITKFPRETIEDDLRDKFRRFGKIREISMKRNFAFVVSFVLSEEAKQCLTAGVR